MINVNITKEGILNAYDFLENTNIASIGMGNEIPSIYTVLEYIESSGTQYIDTGYYWQHENTKIETDLMIVSNPSNQTLFGDEEYATSALTMASRNFSSILHGMNGNFSIYCGTGSVGTVSIGVGTKRKIVYSTTIDKKVSVSVDSTNFGPVSYGASIMTHNCYGSSANKGTIFIFSNHADNSVGATQIISGMRLYNFKMYDNNQLVRYFIPTKRNSDNVIGLYEIVEQKFYINNGSGNFIAGSVLTTPLTTTNNCVNGNYFYEY